MRAQNCMLHQHCSSQDELAIGDAGLARLCIPRPAHCDDTQKIPECLHVQKDCHAKGAGAGSTRSFFESCWLLWPMISLAPTPVYQSCRQQKMHQRACINATLGQEQRTHYGQGVSTSSMCVVCIMRFNSIHQLRPPHGPHCVTASKADQDQVEENKHGKRVPALLPIWLRNQSGNCSLML